MITKERLEMIQTISELEEIGVLSYDIGNRGGYLGMYSEVVSELLDIDSNLLPNKVGVYVNYLGGGVRGNISKSDYSSYIKGEKKELLDAFISACSRVYMDAEDGSGLNDEYYEDDDINWDVIATKSARNAKIHSAY